jgi:predicted  nucleic acid-binding Zn-ribbon protein
LRAQIEILATLQGVDREIKEKSNARELLLEELRKGTEQVQEKKLEVAQLTSAWSERDKLRQTKEQLLQEEGRKATDKRMRMNRIKNIRELQALQYEVDQIKQANAQIETELITILEDLEAREAALKQKGEELSGLETTWNQKKREIEAQVAEIERAVNEASSGRRTIAQQINGDLIARYELIFARRGGMAVVAVAGGICQGCFMNIPPQLSNEIMKSETLNLCPSCHRILYSKPAVSEDKHI